MKINVRIVTCSCKNKNYSIYQESLGKCNKCGKILNEAIDIIIDVQERELILNSNTGKPKII